LHKQKNPTKSGFFDIGAQGHNCRRGVCAIKQGVLYYLCFQMPLEFSPKDSKMTAVVHGGNLGRWFEELCRIKHAQIKQVAQSTGKSLKPSALPHKGGVYAFWWTGPRDVLKSNNCNRHLVLHGPGGRPVPIEINDEWLGLDTDLPIPLYVGKNASNLAKRIGQHLRLGDERMLPLGDRKTKHSLPTTTCQLRAGIEHWFQHESDTRTFILEYVGLSYVILDDAEHAVNRFYLEDLAIGLMRPPFNIDIER
jgi:hypothetical protein